MKNSCSLPNILHDLEQFDKVYTQFISLSRQIINNSSYKKFNIQLDSRTKETKINLLYDELDLIINSYNNITNLISLSSYII